MKKHYDDALAAAATYAARRDRTTGEVRDYLASLGFSEEETEEAICALREGLLLDDEAYARDFVQTCMVTPHSKSSVRAKLKKHKVPDEIIEAALEGLDTDADNAYAESFSFLHNAMRGDYDLPALRQKLFRRLIAHGYPYDTARAAIERAEAEIQGSWSSD